MQATARMRAQFAIYTNTDTSGAAVCLPPDNDETIRDSVSGGELCAPPKVIYSKYNAPKIYIQTKISHTYLGWYIECYQAAQ